MSLATESNGKEDPRIPVHVTARGWRAARVTYIVWAVDVRVPLVKVLDGIGEVAGPLPSVRQGDVHPIDRKDGPGHGRAVIVRHLSVILEVVLQYVRIHPHPKREIEHHRVGLLHRRFREGSVKTIVLWMVPSLELGVAWYSNVEWDRQSSCDFAPLRWRRDV